MFSTPATRRAITPHPRLVSASKMVLFLLCLMYLLTYIDRVNVSMASAVFDKELKLGRTQVGFIFSAFAYPYLVFQILGGYFGDHFGPRKVLTICSLIWAGATILTGLAGGFVSMIAARLLLGFGEGPTLPTATSALSSWTKPADRAFAQGLTHSFARIGNALTPPIVVALIGWVGWRGSFVVMGMASCIWMFVWFLCFRDNPAKHKRITQVELEALPSYLDGAARKRHPVPWGPLFVRMLPVTFVYFCYGWTLWLFLSWLPQYFKNQHHLDLDKAAIFSAGVFFAGVVGDTLGGMISDHVYRKTRDLKMARRNLVVLFYLCSLGCMVSLFFTEDLKLLACSLSGAFFFAEMTIGPMWSIPMDIAPRYSGSASGIMNTGSALAAILSPVVFGAVIDKTHNWSLPFLGSMGLFLAGSVVAFWMKPEEAFKIAATPGEI
jgi:MFS family permease